MPLIKLNNRSIKDVTSLPFAVGNLIHIQSQTASNSASISFTTGINSTYKEYQFWCINCHPANNDVFLTFNLSTDGGSTYAVTKTTTSFISFQNEAGTDAGLQYQGGSDLAQGTGFQILTEGIGNTNDDHGSGILQLFNPASTTYVKHFIGNFEKSNGTGYSVNSYTAGYGNTTSAINAVQFKMSSGNIDDGTIALFGVV